MNKIIKPTTGQDALIPDSDNLLKQSLSYIYLFAAAAHVFFLFLFARLGVKEMEVVNYFSPFLYIIAFWLNHKNHIVWGATLAIGEAVAHGLISLFFVGWHTYFHIYIILVYLLIFFLYKFNLFLRITFTAIVSLLYIASFVYAGFTPPKYTLSGHIIVLCGIVNITSTAATLSIFAISYSHFIRRNIGLLKSAEQQQRTLNAQKNRFFSIFSHDLKNPLTTLNGFVDLMLHNYDKIDDAKRKDFLIQIQNSVGDLQKLLNGLLEWSRSQLDKIHMHPEVIDLAPTLLEIKSLFEHHAIQKNIALEMQIDKNITVYADEQMFRSVMRNLISNAIKFTHRNGKILVTSGTNGTTSEIIITDNGVGISKKNLENLFQIDKKIFSTGTENEPGTGLGLIVTKEFVEKNKGNIRVSSIEEKGSIFTVTLPSKKI
ncbi:MAG: HAMP domain-containing histidine kinase [Bacteroidales bacterium]|nr:HAMP domain-containing histidine kinase [Bacteroidales bacterium]